jgi:hypothetical protein
VVGKSPEILLKWFWRANLPAQSSKKKSYLLQEEKSVVGKTDPFQSHIALNTQTCSYPDTGLRLTLALYICDIYIYGPNVDILLLRRKWLVVARECEKNEGN